LRAQITRGGTTAARPAAARLPLPAACLLLGLGSAAAADTAGAGRRAWRLLGAAGWLAGVGGGIIRVLARRCAALARAQEAQQDRQLLPAELPLLLRHIEPAEIKLLRATAARALHFSD
jgi:hypothetical protein